MSQAPITNPLRPSGAVSPVPQHRPGWTPGRITSLVVGSLLALMALGMIAAGGVATWATNNRDAGYVTSAAQTITTTGYAVTSDQVEFWSGASWITPNDVIGTVRLRATATNGVDRVFIGVGPTTAVDGYLAGVSRRVVNGWSPFDSHEVNAAASATPRTAPAEARVWTAQVSGSGPQELTWRPTGGQWTLVIMNASGRAPVSVSSDIGATIPDLGAFAAILFVVGGLVLVGAIVLIRLPIKRAGG